MKIICKTCKQHILNTNDETFVMGGPYDGSMFLPAKEYKFGMFRTIRETVRAKLMCPRCGGAFIGRDGSIVTEHGRVPAGTKQIDTTQNIYHQDGPMKGRLGHIVDAVEIKVDRVAEAAKKNQALMDLYDKCQPNSHVDTENVVTLPLGDAGFFNNKEPETHVKCPKCGKKYQNTDAGMVWYEKHVARCKGKN